MTDFHDRLNQFVKDENGDLWKVVSYCSEPTVTLEKVGLVSDGRPRKHLAVSSRLADNFKPVGEAESKAILEYHRQLMDRSNRR